MKRAKVEANERRENAPLLTLQKGETAHASYILVHVTETALSYPAGLKARKKAVHAFIMEVERKEASMASGVKVSYAKSKAFWDEYQKENLGVDWSKIRALQRKVAAVQTRQAWTMLRAEEVSTTGNLLIEQEWRVLRMGDHTEAVWKEKLSFVPTVQLGHFGAQNFARLQSVNCHGCCFHSWSNLRLATEVQLDTNNKKGCFSVEQSSRVPDITISTTRNLCYLLFLEKVFFVNSN